MSLLLEMFMTRSSCGRSWWVSWWRCARRCWVCPLVLKRYSMIGDGLSHVSLRRIGHRAGLRLGAAAGVYPVVVLAALGAAADDGRSRMGADAAIAVVSASALAVGVVVTSLTSGMTTDVDSNLCSAPSWPWTGRMWR